MNKLNAGAKPKWKIDFMQKLWELSCLSRGKVCPFIHGAYRAYTWLPARMQEFRCFVKRNLSANFWFLWAFDKRKFVDNQSKAFFESSSHLNFKPDISFLKIWWNYQLFLMSTYVKLAMYAHLINIEKQKSFTETRFWIGKPRSQLNKSSKACMSSIALQ